MSNDADVLNTTFVLNTSTLGDKEFIFQNFEIGNYGRFFQFDVRNAILNHQMNIQGLNFIFKSLGVRVNTGL